ncbi:MAG TPA: putative glycoside hydrolase [Candidatus Paceibacterota bacterium]|nr:putative glycoside hydrolase [Candidatus Paceibacterota bacterium]
MRRYLFIFLGVAAVLGAAFLLTKANSISLVAPVSEDDAQTASAQIDAVETDTIAKLQNQNQDIERQLKLANPPKVVKGVYMTSWVGGYASIREKVLKLIDTTELNAVVLDVKDSTGMIGYDSDIADAQKYGTEEKRIPKINTLIKELHDKNIYVIGRIAVFEDPALAKARPDLAVKDSKTGKVWKDRNSLSWVDPTSQEVWDYNIAVAEDALSRGFDEINFDYIRFPTDGDLEAISYPLYQGKTLKAGEIEKFFVYLDERLHKNPEVKISADLFGLSTVNKDDLGIGQVMENALAHFDYVAPMVYPSHYATGFIGYKSPASFPYEVVKYSLDQAIIRLRAGSYKGQLRPWLQDFNLVGVNYYAKEVRAQIQATYDAGLTEGWLIWNAGNVYTADAFLPQ